MERTAAVTQADGDSRTSTRRRRAVRGGIALALAVVIALGPVLAALIARVAIGRPLAPAAAVFAVPLEGLAMVLPAVLGAVAVRRRRQPRLAVAAIVVSIAGNYVAIGLILGVYFLITAVMVAF